MSVETEFCGRFKSSRFLNRKEASKEDVRISELAAWVVDGGQH